MLTRRGRAGKHENSCANDRPDTQRRERPRPESFAQAMAGVFGLRDQLVNGFAAEELPGARFGARFARLISGW
jgi:hypothetical protein